MIKFLLYPHATYHHTQRRLFDLWPAACARLPAYIDSTEQNKIKKYLQNALQLFNIKSSPNWHTSSIQSAVRCHSRILSSLRYSLFISIHLLMVTARLSVHLASWLRVLACSLQNCILLEISFCFLYLRIHHLRWGWLLCALWYAMQWNHRLIFDWTEWPPFKGGNGIWAKCSG